MNDKADYQANFCFSDPIRVLAFPLLHLIRPIALIARNGERFRLWDLSQREEEPWQ